VAHLGYRRRQELQQARNELGDACLILCKAQFRRCQASNAIALWLAKMEYAPTPVVLQCLLVGPAFYDE
jgi:hypothetical protein